MRYLLQISFNLRTSSESLEGEGPAKRTCAFMGSNPPIPPSLSPFLSRPFPGFKMSMHSSGMTSGLPPSFWRRRGRRFWRRAIADATVGFGDDGVSSTSLRLMTPSVRCSRRGEITMEVSRPSTGGSLERSEEENLEMVSRRAG